MIKFYIYYTTYHNKDISVDIHDATDDVCYIRKTHLNRDQVKELRRQLLVAADKITEFLKKDTLSCNFLEGISND